jgi:hypothetical protein
MWSRIFRDIQALAEGNYTVVIKPPDVHKQPGVYYRHPAM